MTTSVSIHKHPNDRWETSFVKTDDIEYVLVRLTTECQDDVGIFFKPGDYQSIETLRNELDRLLKTVLNQEN